MGGGVSAIECRSCGYVGRVLYSHHGYQWWMLPVVLPLACTGIGMVPVLVIFLVLGNRTYRTCPNCASRELSPWHGQPSSQSAEIWSRAKSTDDAAFRKNKLVLFWVVMAMLIASLIFMFVMMRNG